MLKFACLPRPFLFFGVAVSCADGLSELVLKLSVMKESGSSMVLHLSQMAEGEVQFDFVDGQFSFQRGVAEYAILPPVRFLGQASKLEEKVYVKGWARGVVRAACSRCLEPFEIELDERIEVEYVPRSSVEEDDQEKVDDPGLALYARAEINLSSLVEEFLILALPIQPFCRDGCKGLCPYCGCNRNVEECGCGENQADPRFEALKKLRDRL